MLEKPWISGPVGMGLLRRSGGLGILSHTVDRGSDGRCLEAMRKGVGRVENEIDTQEVNMVEVLIRDGWARVKPVLQALHVSRDIGISR